MFVDEAFVNMLQKKFGAEKWTKMNGESRRRLLHNEWEHMIKPKFDGEEKSWKIITPFECLDPSSLKPGAKSPIISLNAADVRGVFDPSVDKILAMVDDQVTQVRGKKGKDPKVRAFTVAARS